MLLGEYEHTLDDKNRLTLPAKFRQALGGGVVVTRGMDGCLFVFTHEGWDSFVSDRLEGLNTFSDVDKQGRIMLPQPLIEHASLGREVVVAGIRDHVEIWDRTAWRKQLDEVEGSVELVAERLAAKQD